jgi:hypothetical protein
MIRVWVVRRFRGCYETRLELPVVVQKRQQSSAVGTE